MARNSCALLAVALTLTATATATYGKVVQNRLAQNRLAQNRLAQNRLAQNRLAQNKLASNKLASNRLSSNRLASSAPGTTRLEADPAATELLASADGREVFSYMISCALPEGTTIEASVPGAADTGPPDTVYSCTNERCVFDGSLGLAEDWAERRLSPKGQRWVTACLLARVNRFEMTESISLRGVAPQLTISDDEAARYSVQEGAFYGNIFGDGDEMDWNACRGQDQASGEFWGLVGRDCTEPDPLDPGRTLCGFKYAGNCGPFPTAPPGPYACRSVDPVEGSYSDCHATAGDGRWPASSRYREVITVYVAGPSQ